jgi:hypothetical protein
MHTIQVTDEDLQLVYQSSMLPHILRILLETNFKTAGGDKTIQQQPYTP